VALILVAVVFRLDGYFREQDQATLDSRTLSVATIVNVDVQRAAAGGPVVLADGNLSPSVAAVLGQPVFLGALANGVALADVTVKVGVIDRTGSDIGDLVPAPNGTFSGKLTVAPQPGQAQEPIGAAHTYPVESGPYPYGLGIELLNPYTYRASTLAALTGLLLVIGGVGIGVSLLVAAFLAARFATPLRRLATAAKLVGEGDLSSRVPLAEANAGSAEIAEVSKRFNAMADRLEESIEIIRLDRDRSREFLADVSHELRTPITSIRTFLELLQGPAGGDPERRAEFLTSSLGQLGRMDWMAANLLELSKLDSGLVLLDLRPEDLRGTVEAAIELSEAAAGRRGVAIGLTLPDAPVRIQHDPLRVGQVVANLVGNGVKFTPRGGRVEVAAGPTDDGAWITVSDTGVGIDADELPHIFDRFYRGSNASEARSEGSGLGLSIVKSIVDMHHGRVTVESRVGVGTTFRVQLPRDPHAAAPPVAGDEVAEEAAATPAHEPLTEPGEASSRRPAANEPSETEPLGEPTRLEPGIEDDRPGVTDVEVEPLVSHTSTRGG
jgi:signal transduction histidine kinase